MTQSLDAAIAKLSKLPPDEQDRIARWLLDEIADEERWDRAFARSQDVLRKLADKVREDERAGQTTDVDADAM